MSSEEAWPQGQCVVCGLLDRQVVCWTLLFKIRKFQTQLCVEIEHMGYQVLGSKRCHGDTARFCRPWGSLKGAFLEEQSMAAGLDQLLPSPKQRHKHAFSDLVLEHCFLLSGVVLE